MDHHLCRRRFDGDAVRRRDFIKRCAGAGLFPSLQFGRRTSVLWGVNMTGGEGYNGTTDYLVQSPEALAAGHYDYAYPTIPELDYYAYKGATIIRLSFLARRIMDPTNGARDIGQINQIIDAAYARGMTVVLGSWGSCGNGTDNACVTYGASKGTAIGLTAQSNTDFAAEWTAIANAFKAKPNIMYSLTNEPSAPTLAQWLTAANGAISAIRATGDTAHTITVPGVNYTNAHYWSTWNSGMTGVVDSAKNFAIEVHGYLDSAGMGVVPAASGAGSTVLADATGWARTNGLKLFLGEYGFGRPSDGPQEATEGAAEQQYIVANSDVWIGACFWAGGPIWDDATYEFLLRPTGLYTYFENAPPTLNNSGVTFDPTTTTDKPQMSVMAQVW